MAIGKIETQEFVSLRDTRKVLQKTFQEWFLFLQGDTENEFGEPIWLGRIYPNMVNDEFQKEPLWETDKRIKLDGIRLYCGDIGLEIEWYEQVPVIVESDLIHRLYCGQLPQVQSHT